MRTLLALTGVACLFLGLGCGDSSPNEPEFPPLQTGKVIFGVTIPPVQPGLNNRTCVWEIPVYGDEAWCEIPDELRNGFEMAWPCSILAIQVKADFVVFGCPCLGTADSAKTGE